MKKTLSISTLVLAAALCGCHHGSSAKARTAAPTSAATKPDGSAANRTIITPDNSLAATVLRVNPVGRFVVLNFPSGRMPRLDQHLFLYRGGLREAEVKVVGPQYDYNIVADLLSGEPQVGDLVRDE